MERRRCTNCNKPFKITRNPDQYYCSDHACQAERKRVWGKAQQDNPQFKLGKQAAQQRWAQSHPDYWKNYRSKKTKILQEVDPAPSKKQHPSHVPFHVKSDGLQPAFLLDSGLYRIQRLEDDGSVKSDAIVVKISVISNTCKQ